MRARMALLQAMCRPGFNYAKAGVKLVDLWPQGQQQGELDLFGAGSETAGAPSADPVRLMTVRQLRVAPWVPIRRRGGVHCGG